MASLCRLVDAGNAYWISGTRMAPSMKDDPLLGWRPIANRYLHPAPIHEEAYKAQVSKWNRREVDLSYKVALRGAGTFRHHRLRQALPPEWFSEPYYLIYQASRGFHDTSFVTLPINEDVESYFAFHRMNSDRDFSLAEEELLADALRPLKWFNRQLLLSHGLPLAGNPLTPTQRRVAKLLLTDKSEKEIGAKLGQSFHTTHRHVMEIYRKFGVTGRAGFMARWQGTSK